jgi:hypothetical protein
MDKPPLLLPCKGKLGGHAGEAGVIPPPPVTSSMGKGCVTVLNPQRVRPQSSKWGTVFHVSEKEQFGRISVLIA